jgi:hypothetical protein
MFLHAESQFFAPQCPQAKRDMNRQGNKNQTDFEDWQRRAQAMNVVHRRLKPRRPPNQRVQGQVQQEKSAQRKSAPGEVTARAGVPAAIALVFRLRAKFQRKNGARVRPRGGGTGLVSVSAAATGIVSAAGFY